MRSKEILKKFKSLAQLPEYMGDMVNAIQRWIDCDLLVLQNPKFHESLNGTAKVFLIQGSSPLPEDIAKVFWKAFHWLM